MRVCFPGFVDLQVNGFAGVDFNTTGNPPERILAALAAIRATGVTRCLPTLITSSFEHFAACARELTTCTDATIAGLHMEGPYISPLDGVRGAHPQAHVTAAALDDFQRRQDAASGRIVIVTLAPEVPGALEMIEYLVTQNIRVALGHTAARREQIRAAISAGATLSTHLGNGCPQMLPRHDNVIWEQLAADELSASLIADGHHLPAAVVKSLVRAKGFSRTILVTDAVAAAGSPPGRYRLGGLDIEHEATGRVTPPGAAHLAGSSLTMDVAVANTSRYCGLSLEEVLPLAVGNPARMLGIEPAGQVTAEWNSAAHQLSISSVALN